VPPNFSAEYLRESAGTTYIGDPSKARRELGWEARSIADGLPEVIRFEMAALAAGRDNLPHVA
jgi:nucleoside-diphosphate-sugar epimerase